MFNQNSLIVGPGSIGALVCAHNQTTSNCYAFAHRPNLTLTECLITSDQPLTLNWQVTAHPKDIHLIWVCCKATNAYHTTKKLLESLPAAHAIMLHNGMGPQQALSKEFPNRVIWGSTTCSALRKDNNTIVQTASGQTQIGLPNQQAISDALKEMILPGNTESNRILDIEFTDSIEQTLWYKVLINAAINPITAVHQITNGQLLNKEFKADIHNICNESCMIMKQAGITPPSDPVALVMQVAEITAKNRSSMAEDIRCGRHTEIDFINGFLINQARQQKLKTPHLEKWYSAVAQKSKY
jgi:2-dehydropantoate 2-reductase